MKRVMILAAVVGLIGCAGPEKQLKMMDGGTGKSGVKNAEGRLIVFPNGTVFGGASAEQMGRLAEILVDSHNAAMLRMDEAAEGQGKTTLTVIESQKQIQISNLRIEESAKKNLETAQQILKMIEEISKRQGSGEITLFYGKGSARLAKGSAETARLVGFLDFVARESRGRKVLIVSIGSASSVGNAKMNRRLSRQRAESPLPLIEKYLVNVPHEMYRVYGTGDLYSPKKIPRTRHQAYQHTRIIAFYEADHPPSLPEERRMPAGSS